MCRPALTAGAALLALVLLPAAGLAQHAGGRHAGPSTAAEVSAAAPKGDAPKADTTKADATKAADDDAAKKKDDAAADPKKLPADVTTDQTVTIGGRAVKFRATAGSIPLLDAESGDLRAEVGFVAYTMGDPASRPVTFLFNGGPGAASAYLNIGAVGPWRLPLAGATASTPPVLVPNGESWLDFTDLVFVDPPGTGYSRIVGGDKVRERFWSIEGDADALAVAVRKWIVKNGRERSPKFLVGESYGGFRVPMIARALAREEGIGVRGMVLISPVLDFTTLAKRDHAPMGWVMHLPSMAAAALEARHAFDEKALAEAEHYATGDYLADLLRGERDAEAVARMSDKVAALTGLDPALVRRLAGRVDNRTFQRELFRERGLIGSAYDAAVTAYDPTPAAARSRYLDPVLDATKAPITAAMTQLYRDTLGWTIDRPYALLNDAVSSQWNWGGGRSAPEVVDEVRDFLASDPKTRLMVAHGAADLVTPYFANKLILQQLPVYGEASRATLEVYRGGHMFYSEDGSREKFRRDAEAFFRAALNGAEKTGEAGAKPKK